MVHNLDLSRTLHFDHAQLHKGNSQVSLIIARRNASNPIGHKAHITKNNFFIIKRCSRAQWKLGSCPGILGKVCGFFFP